MPDDHRTWSQGPRCRQCQAMIATGATHCPSCGEPAPKRASSEVGASTDVAEATSNDNADVHVNAPASPAASHVAQPAAGAGDESQFVWQGGFSSQALLPVALQWLFVAALMIAATALVLPATAAWVFVTLWLLLLAGCQFGWVVYRMNGNFYGFDDRQVVQRRHPWQSRRALPLAEIHEVSAHQNLLERLVGVGSLRIEPESPQQPGWIWRGVANPRHVAEELNRRLASAEAHPAHATAQDVEAG